MGSDSIDFHFQDINTILAPDSKTSMGSDLIDLGLRHIDMMITPDSMNTVLYCQHFASTLEFYEHILGLPRGFANDWFVEFKVADRAYLSVADQSRATINSAHGAGITLTFRVDNVSAYHAQLVARGAAPSAIGRRPWNATGFLLYDPEGTRIEVWSPA